MSFEVIDTHFLGIDRAIACHLRDGVLIDPGPESSLQHIFDALGDRVPSAVLLTHVHLDHAGGTGRLVERYPDLQVYIHRDGARHMVDPSRLVASATRIYGETMSMWGEVLPIPEANVHALDDGDVVHGYEAVHTPGHSGHHMAFLHLETRHALVGDLVGQVLDGYDLRLLSTPPPEIDVEAWESSLDRLLEHETPPQTLGLTHFGHLPDAAAQLVAARKEIRRLAELVRDGDEEDFARDFEARLKTVPPDVAQSLGGALPAGFNHAGLARYWQKREG